MPCLPGLLLTLGRKVLKPRTSSLWPLNSSLTRWMTPAVSILQRKARPGCLRPLGGSRPTWGQLQVPTSPDAGAQTRQCAPGARIRLPELAATPHLWALNSFMISRKVSYTCLSF